MTEITKQTFSGYSTGSKLDTLFDLAVDTKGHVEKLETVKKWSNTYAFFGGMGAAITLFLGQLGFKVWQSGA